MINLNLLILNLQFFIIDQDKNFYKNLESFFVK